MKLDNDQGIVDDAVVSLVVLRGGGAGVRIEKVKFAAFVYVVWIAFSIALFLSWFCSGFASEK